MEFLIDSSLWIDFTRRKSPPALKAQVLPWIVKRESVTCDVVVFEVMRNAAKDERRGLTAQFQTVPVLESPESLWEDAMTLGQACRDGGFSIGPLDILIASVALHHEAEVVTFDGDYALIAKVSSLKVHLLERAAQPRAR